MLLDALDELTETESGPVRELVRSSADQAGDRARCVITSRIAGYTGSPLPDAQEVELQAFTPEETDAAIEAWRLPPAGAAQLRDRLRDPAAGAMARIPLLLALLCSLAAQAPGGEGLPATRGQLYERVLQWFLTGAHRSLDDPGAPARDNVEVDALLQILAPLAFTFATQPAGWTDLMPTDSLLNAIRAAGPAFTELGRPAKDVLRELSVGAGVLVPDSDPSAGRSPRYLFLHRTVAEYLTARHLATLPEPDWLAVVRQHQWFDADWAEVIPMLGERLSADGVRPLIQHLLADECDPFHYALFAVARVWGARPDASHLLAPGQADELAGRLDDLFKHWLTRQSASLTYAQMTYLPRPVLTRLMARLTDPDENVRAQAVEALADRSGPEVTEALLGCLIDQNWSVRARAVEALAGRQDLGVTQALLGRLTDQNWSARHLAVEALAGREGPGVTGALLGLLTDPDGELRYAAVKALAGRQDLGVTEALLRCLTDPDEQMRYAAVEALARRQDLGVTEALLRCLTDPDGELQYAAVEALAGRHDPGVTEALLRCLTDPEESVLGAAAGALAGRHDPGVTEALLHLLASQDEEVRYAAVGALAGRQDPGVTEALLGCLTDQTRFMRYAAVEALAGRHDLGVTEALLGCLTDQTWFMRYAAVEALAGRHDLGVTEALLGCLTDHDEQMRYAAVGALAGRQDPGVTEALLRCLTDQTRFVRHAAAGALAGRQGSGVTEALLRCLTDPDGYVRGAAVGGLAGRHDPGLIEALLRCLSNQSVHVRVAAMRALGGQESPEALLIMARRVRTFSGSLLPAVADAAELLMIRHYRRIDPADQPEVLAAMGWLTTVALSERSA